MKKVAFLGIKGLPSQAGVDRVVEAIVQGINKTRYQPFVYVSARVVPEDVSIPHITLLRMPTLPGKHLHAISLFLFSALHAVLVGRYDLIHLHNVEASFVLPLLRLRYQVITTSHGAAQLRDKWGMLAKLLIRLMEFPYIWLSNCKTAVSKPLTELYCGKYKQHIHYLPNGVDPNEMVDERGAAELLAARNVEPGAFILFAAGRIIPTKGCHDLLEAFSGMQTGLHLIIVGDSSHMPAYERKLRTMADERVHFIPFIAEKSILFGLVKQARCFVFPSTVEAMSMMLLEVAAMGTPIVCSDIPENMAILPEQTLFFKSGNAQDLRVKLQAAIDQPEQMTDLATQTKQWVYEKYQWQNIVSGYEQLYARFAR